MPEEATNKNVTWSSNAPDIVSVDQTGKVTVVSDITTPATVEITVTSVENDRISDSIIVVVQPKNN